MAKLFGALCLCLGFFTACDKGPPVKSASGERLDHITIEEQFSTSDKVKETKLEGDQLRTAVELMEKRGVMALNGTFESKAVVASGTVTITVKPASGAERRIVVKSCIHEGVCGFLDDALAKGLIDHKPVACKSEAACSK